MHLKSIMKILVIFWGIILSLIIIKEIIPTLPTNFDFLSTINFTSDTGDVDKDEIYFPLAEQYGFTLERTKSCIKEHQSGLYEKGFNYDTQGSCWNGSCSLDITFTQKIPDSLNLYIEKNSVCHLEKIKVPKSLKTVGYVLDLKLTQSQKTKLGILDTGKIRLKKANGYSINPQHQLYFYTNKIDQDIMLIDDKKIGTIYFSMDKSLKDIKNPQEDASLPELDIPHPKDLFTYTCNDKTCKKVANTYVLNVDGVDFIPSTDFIRSCMLDTQSSSYCKYLTNIGTVLNMNKPSTQLLASLQNSAKNPEVNDNLKDWEKARLEKAQAKVSASLR